MNGGKEKPTVHVGLIGAGFMGKCHANAFKAAPGLFDLPASPELTLLADIDEQTAPCFGGFARHCERDRRLERSDRASGGRRRRDYSPQPPSC